MAANLRWSKRRHAVAAVGLGWPHEQMVTFEKDCELGENAHNVAADGVEMKVEFCCRGEAAVSHDARGQPPAAGHMTTHHMRITFENVHVKSRAWLAMRERNRTFGEFHCRCEEGRGK